MPNTLLIVEDEPQLAALLREILNEGGYQAVLSTGSAAAAAAADLKPDVIIIDYVMPGMNGAEVVAKMRKELNGAALPPLVLVTGREDVADLAERVGATAYLRKPFDVDELLKVVTRLIGTE